MLLSSRNTEKLHIFDKRSYENSDIRLVLNITFEKISMSTLQAVSAAIVMPTFEK